MGPPNEPINGRSRPLMLAAGRSIHPPAGPKHRTPQGRRGINLRLAAALAIILAAAFTALSMAGIILPFQPVTSESIAEARSGLVNDMAAGRTDMGITLPPISLARPGDASDGIEIMFRNTGSNPRCYILYIGLTGADSLASSAYTDRGNCFNPSCPDFHRISRAAEEWFAIRPSAMPLDVRETGSANVSLRIPGDAEPGMYAFTAYAHPAEPLLPPGECRAGLGRSHADPGALPETGQFQIEVRGRV